MKPHIDAGMDGGSVLRSCGDGQAQACPYQGGRGRLQDSDHISARASARCSLPRLSDCVRCCSTLALTLMGETPIGDKLSPIGELKGVRGPLSLAEREVPAAVLGVQCKQRSSRWMSN